MTLLSVFLALLPILVVLILLIWKRMAADTAGLIAWIVAMLTACLYFQTPLQIALTASLAGVVASLPITLMVAASILQITIMIESGAIARVVALIKSVAPKDQIVQIMIVNIGFGTLLAALGATPVSILPPIMLAMGYSSFIAIALPSLGYDALTTYALLGIPVVVFASFVGLAGERSRRLFCALHAGHQFVHCAGDVVDRRRVENALARPHPSPLVRFDRRPDRHRDERRRHGHTDRRRGRAWASSWSC